MDVESTRSLLSALIATLPTVLSLGLVALFAFPKTSSGFIKKSDLYVKSIASIVTLFAIFFSAILSNILAFMNIDNPGHIYWAIILSVFAIMSMPIFLIWYLFRISQNLSRRK